MESEIGGLGVAVGWGVGVGGGGGVAVGGTGVAVGTVVAVGMAVAVGADVGVGSGTTVGGGVLVATTAGIVAAAVAATGVSSTTIWVQAANTNKNTAAAITAAVSLRAGNKGRPRGFSKAVST